jgi:hypothetical protein
MSNTLFSSQGAPGLQSIVPQTPPSARGGIFALLLDDLQQTSSWPSPAGDKSNAEQEGHGVNVGREER